MHQIFRDIISNGKDGKVTDAEAKLLDEAKEYITKFEEAMDDDCNTANAISAVFELVKFANSNLNEGSTKEFAAGVYEILDKLCNVLGIILSSPFFADSIRSSLKLSGLL